MGIEITGELLAFAMFGVLCLVLMVGYPVAPTLAGVALMFAGIGHYLGVFDDAFLTAFPNRAYGIMTSETLLAVPLFVFMGVMLEKARIAEDLLDTMSLIFGPLRGGLGISVMVVGALLAASTGIVGATVVTMGLLSLPTMIKRGYSPELSCGAICAAGTLGQIIPPSIILVLLGEVLGAAYQQSQLNQGIFAPDSISVGDLFAGALIPGLLLVGLYISYLITLAFIAPKSCPAIALVERQKYSHFQLAIRVIAVLIPPFVLIAAVLGSILMGIATPTEAAAVGAVGTLILALFRGRLNYPNVRDGMRNTTEITAMVFFVLIAASVFALVFRGLGGDEALHHYLSNLPGGPFAALITVMVVMFLLGFVLDFVEIIFIIVPVVAPVLLTMGFDPVWLGVMIAINLQTSFLTPPFGFALFYLRGVAPDTVSTWAIYRGVVPFIVLQLVALGLLVGFPWLATWLPQQIYG